MKDAVMAIIVPFSFCHEISSSHGYHHDITNLEGNNLRQFGFMLNRDVSRSSSSSALERGHNLPHSSSYHYLGMNARAHGRKRDDSEVSLKLVMLSCLISNTGGHIGEQQPLPPTPSAPSPPYPPPSPSSTTAPRLTQGSKPISQHEN